MVVVVAAMAVVVAAVEKLWKDPLYDLGDWAVLVNVLQS